MNKILILKKDILRNKMILTQQNEIVVSFRYFLMLTKFFTTGGKQKFKFRKQMKFLNCRHFFIVMVDFLDND